MTIRLADSLAHQKYGEDWQELRECEGQVTVEESGEGGGGYAKEMSQAFLDAEVLPCSSTAGGLGMGCSCHTAASRSAA